MMKNRQIDFKEQKFFIGLDVHTNNWAVTIRCNGLELKTFSTNPSAKELCRYMTRHYPGGEYYSVYEAGIFGFGIHRELTELGFKNIVINPADVPTKHKERKGKRDKVDSRKLARELENGSLEPIYIPDEAIQQLRSLNRLRFQIVTSKRRVMNRIKALLHFNGIKIIDRSEMNHWSGAFIKWLESVEFSHQPGYETLIFLIEELRCHRQRLSSVMRSLRKYCREYEANELINLLRTIPGIGFVVAVTLYLEIIDICRFKDLDHIASFVGFVPSVDSSGDVEKVLGLTKRRCRYLRSLLVEAAWIAVRKDPAMTLAFNKLTKRMSSQRAIIHIAKKLLNRIRYVWKNRQPYVPAVIE